jgi:hypothetical protein
LGEIRFPHLRSTRLTGWIAIYVSVLANMKCAHMTSQPLW